MAALLIGFMTHRGYYTRKMRQPSGSVLEQPDLGIESRIANLLALPAFFATFAYVFIPPWMSWSDLNLPVWARWLGVGIALAGFALLQWSQLSLGINWSDAPKLFAEQQLVTHGPYRWIRHPIYAAFLLILGSLSLISANWFLGLIWIVMTALDVFARINVEEKMMLKEFGGTYKAYMTRTGRLFPQLFKRGELE